ncbi:MAG: NADPH-dependent glutamate synthase [Eubacteriales bacterium]|nr:NADPH-dependent glutamate synthase [Eubacteriales bacterium]
MANLKVNMSMTKNPMPEQDPIVRAGNFEEVALGYDAETAMKEAQRCLDCKNAPCRTGCPVAVKIPRFLEKVRDGDFDAAYDIITSTNSLPAVCGRVCPQEKQCESKCVRGIKGESVGIGRLERFVADYHMAKENLPDPVAPESNGHRIAVIGSGPAGLTCAGDLRKMGYDVTIYEAFHKSGGVLVYGIPQFRLPKEIVAAEIANLQKMGVKIVNNAIIGKSITVDELFEDGYEAVFIGSGAGLPQFLHIPGENLLGVYSANELLTRTNLMKAYRDDYDTPIKKFNRVAVVGAGNVAMDAARVSKRLGAEHVYIVYRRGADELPARKEEVEHAEAEGIEFKLLNNPCAIHGDENGHVTGIECIKQELGEPDEKGRRKPVPVKDSNWILDVDTVVIAIGTSPNPLIRNTTKGLQFTKKGGIEANEGGVTSREGVFAGGDAVTGSATVILAMGAGKAGAKSIDAYIKSKK